MKIHRPLILAYLKPLRFLLLGKVKSAINEFELIFQFRIRSDIYFGESFSCYVSVFNHTDQPLQQVTTKVAYSHYT